MTLIKAENIVKYYGQDKLKNKQKILRGISLEIKSGGLVAIVGPSGAGKSTLLKAISGIESPDEGSIILSGTDLSGLKRPELVRFRRDRIGFVFQDVNLISSLTARENIELPIRLRGNKVDHSRVKQVLRELDVSDYVDKYPDQLSGGQRQRVTLARAFLADPDVIFADEPTGSLDVKTGKKILSYIKSFAGRPNKSAVMVTHDLAHAATADRVIVLVDGTVHAEIDNPDYESVSQVMERVKQTVELS